MNAEENAREQARYFEEMNSGNTAYAEHYLRPGAVYHGPMGRLDRERFLEQHRRIFEAFPDLRFTVEDQFAVEDRVVARWTARGTHLGTFNGIEATNLSVTFTGMIISRFEGGRDVEQWEEVNVLGLLEQIQNPPPKD